MGYYGQQVGVIVTTQASVDSAQLGTAVESIIDQKLAALFGVPSHNAYLFLDWLSKHEAVTEIRTAFEARTRIGG